jgi:hypothetical protein
VACLRQTLDGRSGRPLTHRCYTTGRDTAPVCRQREKLGALSFEFGIGSYAVDNRLGGNGDLVFAFFTHLAHISHGTL